MTELIEASASFAEQPGLRDHATVAGVGSARPGQGRQEAGAGPAVAEATHAAVRATSTNGSHSFG